MATWGQAQNATGKPGGFFMRYMHEIVPMAVNDPYVMAAWGQAQNATGKVGGF
jgi:peroxiredoxin